MTAMLQLHRPRQSSGGELSLDMRLSEFCQAHYYPVYLLSRDARPRNLEEIEQSLKYWIRFTKDPPLREITAWVCRDFVVGLKSLPGRDTPTMSNNTVGKHCRAIQAMIDLCGPRTDRRRSAVGLYTAESVPYLERPPKQKRPVNKVFTFDEIERLLDNCRAATLPICLPCSPREYMQRVYILLYNTALRIGSQMQACWSHYHGDHLLLPPGVVIKGSDWKRIELNETARNVIESMRGYDPIRIFPWPRTWDGSRKGLYDQHDLIKVCLPPERQFAFHAIRRLTNMELARINPKACEKALGHSAGKINNDFYTDHTIVAEALGQMRQPKRAKDRQLGLPLVD